MALSFLLHLFLLAIPAFAEPDVPEELLVDDDEELALVELIEVEPEALSAEDPTPSDAPAPTPGEVEPDDVTIADAAIPDTPKEEKVVDEADRREERHVRLDDAQRTSEVDPNTHRVASRSVVVEEDVRAPVPSLEWGPESPGQVGAPGRIGNAAPTKRSAENADGARREDDAEEVNRKKQAKTVRREEEKQADGTDRGQPTAAGSKSLAERDGGKEGRDLAGEGARKKSIASAGRPAEHIDGSAPSPDKAPDGWEPLALRIDPSEGRPAPSAKASEVEGTVETETQVPVLAREEKRSRATGDGGEGESRAEVPSFDEESPALAELEDEGEPTPESAKAWGGEQLLDPDTEAGATGRVALVGAQATTTPTSVERDVDDGDLTQVSARAHELGPYRDSLEDGIHNRWLELTPLEVRAMGLQGTSVVRFEVDHKGRVVTKTLVKKSGYSQLDQVALASIPTRVERPPKGSADPVFEHTLEFSYTDRWASRQ
ncbi:MAG: TonB family protein [Proteobacteria bacterium]|nr:TonB family protein [Pseudomonadota bacterium]MCP4917057.1 TonB family protein [Pseudomonadota bacterium]